MFINIQNKLNTVYNLWALNSTLQTLLDIKYRGFTIGLINAVFINNISILPAADAALFDISRSWQIGFQRPGSTIMNSIIDLHHDIMLAMVFVVFFITYLLCRVIYLFMYNSEAFKGNRIRHHANLETIWTIIPAVILSGIALPSFSLLYAMDNVIDPKLTVKAIGHQWYWSYESINPEYCKNALNHPELYSNFVDILKRYEVPTGPAYVKTIEYDEVPIRVFLQALVLRDLTCGYKDSTPYLELFSLVKELYEISSETEEYVNTFLDGSVVDWEVPNRLFWHATFFDNPEFDFKVMHLPISDEEHAILLDVLDNTLISGSIDYVFTPVEYNTDHVFTGFLPDWKLVDTYNEYVYKEASALIKRISPNYKKHVLDDDLFFLWEASEGTPFTYAKTQRHAQPSNYHIYIRWTNDASEFPVYYIPDTTGIPAMIPEGSPKPLTIYRVSSRLNRNSYLDYGFDYDSCLSSDKTLDKHRNKVRNILPIDYRFKRYDMSFRYATKLKYSGWFRLLDVDNRLVLPKETNIRFLITSADVIHSWAIPSLGIKLDACPGRLNEMSTYAFREGMYYGQCSEICGLNHGFMPVAVQVTADVAYKEWFISTAKASIH